VRLRVVYIVTEDGTRYAFALFVRREEPDADVELIPEFQTCDRSEREELPV
jgi:hypothetical protein